MLDKDKFTYPMNRIGLVFEFIRVKNNVRYQFYSKLYKTFFEAEMDILNQIKSDKRLDELHNTITELSLVRNTIPFVGSYLPRLIRDEHLYIIGRARKIY